jgi:hypothetical protein
MDVSCECCVLSDRGLCDGPITRPECGVCDCYPETLAVRKPRFTILIAAIPLCVVIK